jgi:two-component system, cell cycle sensor histidine kinase and response regulator CckA
MQFWPAVAYDLLRLNSDWLWEISVSGELTNWSASSELSNNQFSEPFQAGRNWYSYLRQDSPTRPGLAQVLRHLKKREPFRCVRLACRLPHANVMGWVRASGIPVYDEEGSYLGYRGAAQNITGQMLSERKMDRLASHNQNLLSAIDASPTLVMMANLGRARWPVMYANPALLGLSGYALDEVMGRPVFFFVAQEDVASLHKLQESAEFRMEAAADLRLRRKDGQLVWVRVTIVPGCREGGQCVLIVVVRDISAQMAYAQAQEQRTRLEALGRVAGGMAHEINNLLQPAQLNAEILSADRTPDHPDQPLLLDITESLKQISFIVRNTLQFSRKDVAEAATPRPARCLLVQRLDYLRTLLPTTVTITRQGVETLTSHLAINPTELAQVLTNLATNAVHAMQGHGTLDFSAKEVRLDGVTQRVAGLPLGNYVQVAVRDTGSGMSEQTQAKIFEPFFTTKPVGEGTGLGLSVVYGLVQGWGGLITVHSVLGGGTTFTLWLPVVDAPVNTQGGDHEQESSVG